MNFITPRIKEEAISMIVPPIVKLKTNKIALIDADYIKYLVCASIKKELDKGVAYVYEDPAIKFTKYYVGNIFDTFDCGGFIFCFSGSSENTFRTAVGFDKKYKGNRVYTPLYEGELLDKATCLRYIKERYPALLYKDLEADDLINMLQDEDTFIYSNDKDAKQKSGTHYDISTGRFVEISKEEGLKFLMNQMITGDAVDNIAGLKGSGIVKSAKLLTNLSSRESVHKVFKQYIIENGYINGIDMFVESWNLLKLRDKRGDYFLSKYQGAFDVLNMIKLNIQKDGQNT